METDIPPLPPANTGFDGRVFLTDAEYATYLRRMPVRYPRKDMTSPGEDAVCSVCGEPPSPDNPLQVCHRIPFGEGIRRWRLTPEWLDRPDNLRWAHRTRCNKLVELSPLAAGEIVRGLTS